MNTHVDRMTSLEVDIDVRLAMLWQEAFCIEEWDLATVGVFLRAAFGAGYIQALSDPTVGQLCRIHGYATPERRAA